VAEKRLEIVAFAFREDLAVTLVVESIDHDAVVARQLAKILRHRVAERLQARRGENVLDRIFEGRRDVDRRPGPFELDDETAVRRMMQQRREALVVLAE